MTTIEKPRPAARPEEKPETDAYDLSKIQERHPDWPKLELSFYFANHSVKSDTEDILPHIAEADIVLYEDVSRDDEFKAFFNEMATDPKKGLENLNWTLVRGTDVENLVMGLKGTNKVAATIDIGKTAKERDMVKRLGDLLKQPVPRVAEFSDAVRLYREKCEQIATLQSEREDMMVANFEEEIEQVLKSRPDLMQKHELKILVSMGLYHTRLGHIFTKSGMKTDRHFSTKSYTYGYQNEAIRNFTFHKEPSDELIQRSVTESIVDTYVQQKLRGRDKIKSATITTYLRNTVSALTVEDMEDIYDAYREGHLSTELLDGLLASRHLYYIPRDRDELEHISEELSHRKKKSLAKAAMRV